MASSTPRFLSGIQPSGSLHLGNYFGAIREHVAAQDLGESYYFIADYHALTTLRDAERLKRESFEAAVTYIACGLDPERAVLFRQSDVPEVTEITWLLLTATPMHLLEKATSYKDKLARGLSANAGLFTYPVLMAADILAQDSDLVPVGKDQVQHVEITRDVAQRFNREYGQEAFKEPNYKLGDAPYVPGLDGAKMSKSYDNTIPILGDPKKVRKKIMRIKTDSLTPEDTKDPEESIIYQIYKVVATEAHAEALAKRYREGGLSYGEAKTVLYEAVEELLAPIRERAAELRERPDYIEDVLRAGAVQARANARAVLDRAREACGLSAGAGAALRG